MILNIRDFDLKTRLFIRYTKIINVYDQVIDRGYIYLGAYIKKRKAIEDIGQDRIITKKIIFINNFNVYNSKWNYIYERLTSVKLLEKLLNKYNLIIINEEGVLIRRLSEKIVYYRSNNHIIELKRFYNVIYFRKSIFVNIRL